MSRTLRLLPEAIEEFNEAVNWHESQRAGSGADFVARIREVQDRIRKNPRMHGVVYQDVRKAVVQKLRYVVLYREEGSEVVVISIFHTSRDPSIWQGRVQPED